jgi:SAM-dependent methyltransferase
VYNVEVDDIEIQQLEELESTHFWYLARKMQLSRWLSRERNSLNVLDLGSATGGNTLHITSMGHQVTSVEYSKIGAQIQRSKGISVIEADARELPFREASFDVVICLDVLEHIVEDGVVANEIHRVLKPGGKFLISVPEDPSLWSEHDLAVNHVRRYTKSLLLEVVENSGLSYQNIWSTLRYLKPIVVYSRRRSKGSSLTRMNPVINFVLYQICKIEIFMPKRAGNGVTLWIDGRK